MQTPSPAPTPEPDATDSRLPPLRERARTALILSALLHLLIVGTLAWFAQAHPRGDRANPLQIALQSATPPGDTDTVPVETEIVPLPMPAATPADPTQPRSELPPPPPVAPSAPASSTPAADPGGFDTALLDAVRRNYLFNLNRWWQNDPPAYPDDLRRANIHGRVGVTFVIDRHGNILSLAISESSGNAALDQAAVDAVRKRSPLPAPPVLPYDTQELELSVDWRLTP